MVEPVKLFIECLLPITQCNIKCHYCYVVQRDNRLMKKAELKYPVSTIAKALRKSRIRLWKTYSIRKPLRWIYPRLPDKLKIWTIKHFVNKY